MLRKKSKEEIIKGKILIWYKKNKRNLPWRSLQKNKLPNPYNIMVSEYMLQQTTVNTVKKRFEQFIEKWPNIDSLSKISNSKILNFWSGLGYYSRATNLLKTAKIIKMKFKSKIPNNYDELIKLPGIGDYTAKAILGIGFNKPVMPVDANIRRILARIYCYDISLENIKNRIKNKSSFFISKNSSTNLIQAFMDYGSIICKPRKPACHICILKTKCIAYKKNFQYIIPSRSKIKSQKIKKYSRAYIFFNERNEILVRRRSAKGMLASMLEIPNDNWVKDKKNLVHDNIVFKLKNKLKYKCVIIYSFSHFNLETEIFFTNVKKNLFPNYKWIRKANINKSGLPTIMKKIINAAF